MEGTRAKIIGILQRQGQASIEELASHLGLAPASVRRHLDILQRDNLVSWDQVRRGAGRPSYLYSLTCTGQEMLPRHYPAIANRIIQEITSLENTEIRQLDGKGLLELTLHKIGQNIAAEHQGRLVNKSLEDRVKEVTKILNEEDCLAEWERTDEGYRILCHNCPYLQVAQSNPTFCIIHSDLIRTLLQGDIVKEQSRATTGERCVYLIEVK